MKENRKIGNSCILYYLYLNGRFKYKCVKVFLTYGWVEAEISVHTL